MKLVCANSFQACTPLQIIKIWNIAGVYERNNSCLRLGCKFYHNFYHNHMEISILVIPTGNVSTGYGLWTVHAEEGRYTHTGQRSVGGSSALNE